MQSEKKIKTIQEEISFCRYAARGGMTFPKFVRLHFEERMVFRDRLHYLHGRNILFFQDSNSEREEDKDDTRRDIFLPRYLRAKRYVVPDVRKASFRGNEE